MLEFALLILLEALFLVKTIHGDCLVVVNSELLQFPILTLRSLSIHLGLIIDVVGREFVRGLLVHSHFVV